MTRWSFDPTKEEKVSRLLDWIQATSHAVATFGVSTILLATHKVFQNIFEQLQKFLESGQRGAIIANAGYRSYMNPQEPAFDWITWPFVVKTLDRTLQQSLAYYDPAAQVLVFVFLLSETGSSVRPFFSISDDLDTYFVLDSDLASKTGCSFLPSNNIP